MSTFNSVNVEVVPYGPDGPAKSVVIRFTTTIFTDRGLGFRALISLSGVRTVAVKESFLDTANAIQAVVRRIVAQKSAAKTIVFLRDEGLALDEVAYVPYAELGCSEPVEPLIPPDQIEWELVPFFGRSYGGSA